LIRAHKKLGRQLEPLIDPGTPGMAKPVVEAGGEV
jgi:hypothetical protein